MRLHDLKPAEGAKKDRKRVGRGDGSGSGSYSGRGMKGQKARSGGQMRPGFEGGQLPIIKAMPRLRGFTNKFRVEYSEINVDQLGGFAANVEVTAKILAEAGILKDAKKPVKVLGRGELSVPLVVEAQKFTGSARQKIEAAGGSVREIS
ncbi:MAG: 50S ribosomal protein L15 [SAR202 cluster bacterium]|nr:50S ribosomal protein L15 [SAR202 cluster bacterium]